MTHWIRSAVRRMKDRRAQSAPATARGGSSRKMSGVSTVEYALILVAVVGLVAAAAAMLGDEFDDLFTSLQTEMTAAETAAENANNAMPTAD